ncbi:hypothetical protein [Vulgatibacter incomptus]|uniref:Cytosol aminopeptidase n=1 Tax=Vulgatibacter incomptus TaxID=1391653 RepID=A0A0K1PCK7_9BACT|nr:hypothetical protein [Vulgatibacter incomptus]AKU91232.1 cytosol aminopeptidase [Vulgatibacter incomptus]
MSRTLQLQAAPLSLEGLDRLDAGDLVLFVGEGDRPLRGLAGFVDWRMCGELTRRVKEGFFAGAAGEALLTVPAGRLPVSRIFVFGAGGGHAPLAVSLRAVVRAGGSDVALCPVGWEVDGAHLSAREAVSAAHEAGIDRLTLLAPDLRAADRALAVAADSFVYARLVEPAAAKAVEPKLAK